jgi:hypothetical protein
MKRHHCKPDDCTHCESIAEERARPTEGANDWRIGQDRYEREMDDRWSA